MNTLAKSFLALLMAVAVILPFSNIYSLDNMDPPWTRPLFNGDPAAPNTTFQQWSGGFSELDQLIFGAGNYNTDIMTSGTSDGTFQIANFYDEEPLKLLYIQLTYSTDVPTSVDSITGFIDNSSNNVFAMHLETSPTVDLGDGFSYHTELWKIEPNPDFESLILLSTFLVTDVVIDTISFTPVPEPATMAILGSSLAVGLLAKRRKAKIIS